MEVTLADLQEHFKGLHTLITCRKHHCQVVSLKKLIITSYKLSFVSFVWYECHSYSYCYKNLFRFQRYSLKRKKKNKNKHTCCLAKLQQYLCVCTCIYVHVCMYLYMSDCSVYLLSVCLSVCLYVCLFVRPSVYLPVSLSWK